MRAYSIRLRRTGRWRRPMYDIVVAFKDARLKGRFHEKLGFYSPITSTKLFFINLRRLSFWLLRGATVSPRVGLLLGKMFPSVLNSKK